MKSQKQEQISSSKQVLLALKEARTRLEKIEYSKNEPIAIIGMGCRFPGGANDPETFWQLLREGKDAITPIPSERWDIDAHYNSNPDTNGKMYIREAGLLSQVDRFSPKFFGISPKEAVSLDPQQRLMLEVSWEALERAGQIPNELKDSQTGVFLGIGQNDYAQFKLNSANIERINPYDASGNGFCFASGRLSYFLGLQGPCLAIDTLVQALTTTDNRATDNRAKLWLVTRGTQSVKSSTEEVSLAASTLWGMGRVISLEHPQLWGGLIDLDSFSSESETQTLMQLLADNNQPDDIELTQVSKHWVCVLLEFLIIFK